MPISRAGWVRGLAGVGGWCPVPRGPRVPAGRRPQQEPRRRAQGTAKHSPTQNRKGG